MKQKQRTLLIDGDIYAYQGAAGAEEAVNFGGDDDDSCRWTVSADLATARKYVDRALEELMDTLGGTKMVVTLSDSVNWRKDILPTYKSNRATTRRPIILPQVRQYVREKFSAFQRPKLEGDDLLGILSGLHELNPGEKVMVTLDKDMSTLPGLHYRPHKAVLGIFEVTTKEADLFHLRQGLAGDATDGYSGCPGWGMTTAEEFLNEPFMLRKETYTVQKGPNAGTEKSRWMKDAIDITSPAVMWRCLMALFAREGVSEEAALVQFQVARILRASDYDFIKKEPKLWQPPH